ncbi:TRAP transporter large permease [Halomonas nitroreducens]|uniref:TRAP transporter large permease protein n=1 Tax=Halomonas nitroreducens TaxID=447425 RepID=A0A431V848_9GAMM|nr:TRAP transporter large permease [Halomonas nitroreducens]RTR06897.1 TRAP transporter large permease [Halomonas nitroreducens]
MDIEVLIDALILIGLLFLGVPAPLCFFAAALFLFVMGGFPNPNFLVSSGFSKLSSLILLAIPLYIFAGGVMTSGGIANRLIDLAESLMARVKGGLGVVLVFATAIFGAISGMSTAAVAAIGSIMIPKMVDRGYDRGYATALVAASSVLALLIPPSSSMILYGWVTNTSITAMFLSPVIPAVLLIGCFSVLNYFLTRKMPVMEPPQRSVRETGIDVWLKTKRAAFGLAMPVIILGCIYGGITTPTEAAAIAVVYAIPVALWVYKGLTFRSFGEVAWKTGQIAAVLMILVFFSSMLARVWTMENVPQTVLEFMLGISDNKIVLLLLINLFLLVVGMFLDDISGVLLASPMLLPVAMSLGIDPVHFGAIVGVNLGMGLITPPTAPILYFAGLIGNTTLPRMIGYSFAFILLGYFPVLLLTTFIPELSLFLPELILDYQPVTP